MLDPGSSHFAGKAMGFRALLWPLAAIAIPALWLVGGRPRPYPYLADIALAVPFVLDGAGNVLGWFAVSGFDAIPHFVGWLFLAICIGLAIAPVVARRSIAFWLVVGLGATVAVAWEVGEYLLQQSGQSGLQLTYANTIQDLAMSTLGAVAGALVVISLLWPPAGTSPTLFGWTRQDS